MKRHINIYSFLLFCVIFALWKVADVRGRCYQNRFLNIHEGIVSTKAQTIEIKDTVGKFYRIRLSRPVMVAQAEQEEEWGYFQFPSIGKTDNGILIVGWSMSGDSHMSYGKKPTRNVNLMMSKDGGKSWYPQDQKYFAVRGRSKVFKKNGEILQVTTPESKDISKYDFFPSQVVEDGNRTYYCLDSLPHDLQGVYFNRWDNFEKKSTSFHAKIYDPGALRYAINGYMPVVWWGDIKELSNGNLVAGVYPSYYLDAHGRILPSAISFFESEDNGLTWRNIGKIPFSIANFDKINKRNKSGFQEPAFEILSDSTFICVMRTGGASPMYKSFSSDRGKTWSVPEPFTPNGVKPSLLLLRNGVLVLASGRPGIQLRFSLDGSGRNWTEPIDMLPYMHSDGSYDANVSCGYPAILEASENSFYIVYSYFNSKDAKGNTRKSIWFRQITVENPKMLR